MGIGETIHGSHGQSQSFGERRPELAVAGVIERADEAGHRRRRGAAAFREALDRHRGRLERVLQHEVRRTPVRFAERRVNERDPVSQIRRRLQNLRHTRSRLVDVRKFS